jgi:hypothetical protein
MVSKEVVVHTVRSTLNVNQDLLEAADAQADVLLKV